MLDRGRDLRLVRESLAELAIAREGGGDHLQGNGPRRPQLASAVDDSHSSLAGDALDHVAGELRPDGQLSAGPSDRSWTHRRRLRRPAASCGSVGSCPSDSERAAVRGLATQEARIVLGQVEHVRACRVRSRSSSRMSPGSSRCFRASPDGTAGPAAAWPPGRRGSGRRSSAQASRRRAPRRTAGRAPSTRPRTARRARTAVAASACRREAPGLVLHTKKPLFGSAGPATSGVCREPLGVQRRLVHARPLLPGRARLGQRDSASASGPSERVGPRRLGQVAAVRSAPRGGSRRRRRQYGELLGDLNRQAGELRGEHAGRLDLERLQARVRAAVALSTRIRSRCSPRAPSASCRSAAGLRG